MTRSIAIAALAGLSVGLATAAGAAPLYTFVDVGLAGQDSYATGINNVGAVVGNTPAVMFITAAGASAQFIDPGPNYSQGQVYGVNDNNQVTGGVSGGGGGIMPFRWDPAAGLTVLPLLAGDSFGVGGHINNAGEVAGVSAGLSDHAVLYSAGAGATLNLGLASDDARAVGVNDAGQATWWRYNGVGGSTAYFYDPATGSTAIGGLDPYANSAAINRYGQIAGYSGADAYLFTPGVGVRDLGSLGGSYTYVAGLNFAGDVVGRSETGTTDEAFLSYGPTMYRLSSLVVNLPAGAVLANAVGINDLGQIAVNAIVGGHAEAWRLDPYTAPGVPEPGAWALMLCGFGLMGARLRTANARGAQADKRSPRMPKCA